MLENQILHDYTAGAPQRGSLANFRRCINGISVRSAHNFLSDNLDDMFPTWSTLHVTAQESKFHFEQLYCFFKWLSEPWVYFSFDSNLAFLSQTV
jgi:hypothetical protein